MSTIDDLFQKVFSLCNKKELRQCFPKNVSSRTTFCMDICTVALGIRAGYLLDTFAPVQGESTLYRLLIQLQQTTTAFDDVRIVYSKKAQQYFFININLLKRLLATLDRDASTTQDSSNTNTKFVLLTEHVQIIPPPHEVITAAKHIAEATATTSSSSSSNSKEPLAIPLPEDLSTSSLIALAGFLLEYPVVYVPSSPSNDHDPDLDRELDHDQDQYQTTSLNGVPLDLYQYTLVRNSNSNQNIKSNLKEQETHYTHTHILLKFSSIASLSTTNPSLKPEHVIKSLDLLFRDRLAGVGIGVGTGTGIGSPGVPGISSPSGISGASSISGVSDVSDNWTPRITHTVVIKDRVCL